MTRTFNLEWPDELSKKLEEAGYTPEQMSQEAARLLAAALFKRRVLSLGQAARFAAMSLWDFIPFLGHQGIPYVDYDEEEIRRETETVEWLSRRPAK